MLLNISNGSSLLSLLQTLAAMLKAVFCICNVALAMSYCCFWCLPLQQQQLLDSPITYPVVHMLLQPARVPATARIRQASASVELLL